MKIYKTKEAAIVSHAGQWYTHKVDDWNQFLNRANLYVSLVNELSSFDSYSGKIEKETLLKPMGSQEIWASGVTYMRSKTARMEESKKAGGGSFYDRVYDADRRNSFLRLQRSARQIPWERSGLEKILGGMFRNRNSLYF